MALKFQSKYTAQQVEEFLDMISDKNQWTDILHSNNTFTGENTFNGVNTFNNTNIFFKSVEVKEHLITNGNLTVNSTTALNGPVSINSNSPLTCSGPATFLAKAYLNNGLEVKGDALFVGEDLSNFTLTNYLKGMFVFKKGVRFEAPEGAFEVVQQNVNIPESWSLIYSDDMPTDLHAITTMESLGIYNSKVNSKIKTECASISEDVRNLEAKMSSRYGTLNQANILKVDSINAPELDNAVPGSICCVVAYENETEISHTYYRYEGVEKGWMTFDDIMRSITQDAIAELYTMLLTQKYGE